MARNLGLSRSLADLEHIIQMPNLRNAYLQEIRARVTQTREAFESGTFDVTIARRAYADYAPDIDLDLFLPRARELFPALNCGLCSTYLRAILQRGTVHRGSYNGERHTVLLINSTVIDITADQFGGPPVYVGALRRPWKLA